MPTPKPVQPLHQGQLLGWLAMGLALTLLVMSLAALSISPTKPIDRTAQTDGVRVTQAGARAFGTLGQGSPVKVSPSALESRAGDSALIAPVPSDITRYEYVYAGTLPSVDLPVLRRQTGLGSAALSGLASTRLTNLINLGNFTKLTAQQVTLSEDQADGYTVSLDYQSGMISLYRLSPDVIFKGEARSFPLPELNPVPTSIPSDAELTAIANDWLAAYDIRRDGLGQPQVRKDWLIGLTRTAAESSSLAYPTDVSLVYPWQINQQQVVDESGNPYGLQVTIAAGTKTVSSLTNLVPLRFEASTYALETDSATILGVAKRGGLYQYQPEPAEGIKTVVITLGSPQVEYSISRYQFDQTNVEYLVPALVFPIVNPPADVPIYLQRVVVPLAKDILDLDSPNGGTTIEPAGPTLDLPVSSTPAAADGAQ